MKIVCDVVRDLLPLYYDGVCSESTKQLVEDHVRNCAECEEEFRLMCGDIGTDTPPVAEEMIARAVKNAWEKSIKEESRSRRKEFFFLAFWLLVGVTLPFMLFLASYKFGNDLDGLAALAEKHLEYEQLTIDAVDKDGTCMAALCSDAEGNQHLILYKCDPFGYDRWKPTGDEYAVSSGELSSWTYITHRGETVLVICGTDLPEEVYGCTYQVGGVVYTCPIENDYIVDVMVIEEDEEINSLPVVLKAR